MASGGVVLIKYLLFFFNFIFWLSGLALIIIGGIIKVNYGDFIQVSDSSITTAPVFLIIIGVVVAIVGFLGCCGAYKENYCMVTTFAVLLAIIFILEIAAGALSYAYRNKLEEFAKKGLQKGVDHYAEEKYKEAMDKIQKQFKCCGVNGPADYQTSNMTEPIKSCCPKEKCEPPKNSSAKYNYFKSGCVSAFEGYMRDHLMILGGVGIGIAFIQLIGIIFSCCLMRSIKKEYEVM